MLDEDSDEEQNSDSLDDVSSDDESDDELFEPDNNSEFDDDDLDDNDLDEDNLDEAKIEALFAPTTGRAGGSGHFGTSFFSTLGSVWRPGGFEDYLMLYSAIKRLATRFYDTQILHSSLAQFIAPSIRREWKRLVHNHDQPFSKARDSNPSRLLDAKHLFEYIRQAVQTSRLDQIQSLACCRSRYTATPHRGGQNTANEVDIPFLIGRKFNVTQADQCSSE
ncbi:hypothetical protein V8E54_003570 [Elaphomyces granulatus]